MVNNGFRKGQLVTFLQDWDRKGSVKVYDLVVYSAGKKQMILVDETGQKFAGANFRPTFLQYGYVGAENEVHLRLTPEQADAAALDLGARVVAIETANKLRAIERNPNDPRFQQAMRDEIAKLHEPRVIR
jgi:hypothetical protein